MHFPIDLDLTLEGRVHHETTSVICLDVSGGVFFANDFHVVSLSPTQKKEMNIALTANYVLNFISIFYKFSIFTQ